MEKLISRLKPYYEIINKQTNGLLDILWNTLTGFKNAQGIEAAASIAYFTIFSIFPLLLTLISLAGFLLSDEEAVNLVMKFTFQAIPANPAGMEAILREIVAKRDISGIIGLVGLLISASGVFLTVARNVNRAWPNAKAHGMFRGQLMAIGLIAVLASTMVVWVVWSSIVSLLLAADFHILNNTYHLQGYLQNPLNNVYYWLTAFMLFLVIYRFLPNTRVRWREASWGALFAALTWILLTRVFHWFLQSGLATYDLLYGSLGTTISLLTWVFISAIILLVGAHLSASIARITRPGNLSSEKSIS